MYRLIFLSLLSFGFLLTACNAQKNTATATAPTAKTEVANQEGPRGPRNGGGEMEAMAAKLGLTDDQATKLKGITEKYAAKTRELREKAGDDRQSVRPQMQALRAERTKEINGMLNADQQAMYAKLVEEEMAKRRQGGGRPGGGN